jgi:hypothetical protein
MRRVRIEQKARRPREDRPPSLPLDARDPDILRAKRLSDPTVKDKRL